MKPNFKKGDCVKLKHGGDDIIMTVDYVRIDNIKHDIHIGCTYGFKGKIEKVEHDQESLERC